METKKEQTITNINTKAAEALASIPEDYSDLSESIAEISDDIYTKSKNLFNGNSEGIEVGYYNSSGVFVNQTSTALQMHTSEFIAVEEGESYVLNEMTFAANEFAFIYLVQFDSDKNFIAGSYQNITKTMMATLPHYIPFVALGKYIRFSYQIVSNVKDKLQLEKGTVGTEYEPYGNRIKVVTEVDDELSEESTNPVQNKAIAKALANIHGGIDFSVFTLPYIKDKKVLTNTKVGYATVKCEEKIERIDCKYIWEKGTTTGSLAVIFTENNKSIDDIVSSPSLHLVISNNKITLDIFGAYEKTGSNGYQRIFQENIAEQALDGETEHTVIFYIPKSGDRFTGKVKVSVDGIEYTGTIDYTQEPFLTVVENGIDGMNLHSAWFEHFTTVTDRWSVSMPMITYFSAEHYANSKWKNIMRDYFDRQDGQLTCDAYGHNYILINSTTGYKR